MAKRTPKGSMGAGGAERKAPEPKPIPMLTISIECPDRPAHFHELGITIESALHELMSEFGVLNWSRITLTASAVGVDGTLVWLIDDEGVRVSRRTVEAYKFGKDESDLFNEEGEPFYAEEPTPSHHGPSRQPPRKSRSKGNPVNHPRPR